MLKIIKIPLHKLFQTSWKTVGDHPREQVIGDTSDGIRTRRSFINNDGNMAMISHIEPKSTREAIGEESWIMAMKEELSQFDRNEVWTLVPKPKIFPLLKQDGYLEIN